jgi:hypothetical protein
MRVTHRHGLIGFQLTCGGSELEQVNIQMPEFSFLSK